LKEGRQKLAHDHGAFSDEGLLVIDSNQRRFSLSPAQIEAHGIVGAVGGAANRDQVVG
jgi:hypothetical protein